jgi:hypothetical protein
MRKTILIPALLLASCLGFAQKVDKQPLEFEFTQLPLKPLAADIKQYSSTVFMTYEADIIAQKEKAQQEYDREMADHPARVAAAEAHHKELMAKYEADMKAWQERSAVSKIVEKKILEENNKPIQPVYYPPSKPYLKEVRHQKIFNAEMLSSTYLKLEGYAKGSDRPVKITVTLYGFENLEPVMKTEESTYYDSKTKTSSKVIKYYYEFSYKHPMNLKVESPAGTVLLDESFSEFAEYSIFKTAPTPSSGINKEEILRRLENDVVEGNLKIINEYLNSQFGFQKRKRNTTLYTVEAKKFEYPEHQQAHEFAQAGYQLMISDPAAAKLKLAEAIKLWEKAMTESNPADNKSRINQNVSIATAFNLVEACIWSNNYSQAENWLNKIGGMEPSKKEREMVEDYKAMLKDHKARWEASK